MIIFSTHYLQQGALNSTAVQYYIQHTLSFQSFTMFYALS